MKFKLLHSFDEEFGHLADFCFEEIQEAYSYADAENSSEYEKHKARAQAAHQTLREVFSKHQQDYDLNENTNTYLSKLDINSKKFVQFNGTALQQQLHKELVETINDTSSLIQAHFDNFHINSIGSVIYHSADLGRCANESNKLEQGFALSDFCQSLLILGKKFTQVIGDGFDVCLKTTSYINNAIDHLGPTINEGIFKGVMQAGEHLKRFIQVAKDNPGRTAKEVGLAMGGVKVALARVILYALTDFEGLCSTTKQLGTNIGDYFSKISGQGFAVDSIALTIELILGSAVRGVISSKTAPLVKQISTIAKVELELAKNAALSNEHIRSLVSPVTDIFGEASQTVKGVFDKGIAAVRKSLSVVAQEPNLVSIHGSVENATKAVANYKLSLDKLDKINRRSLERKIKKIERDIKYHDKIVKAAQAVAEKPSIRSLVKKEQLPQRGKVRFIPTKEARLSRELKKVPWGGDDGFKDKFGNVWVGGASRTLGEDFEWDVQLSKTGVQHFGWATRDNSHLNVSLMGRLTHK